MTDDTVTLVDMDDLDAFENEFYERAPEKEEEEVSETEDDTLETEDDEDAEPQEDESEEEDEDPEEDDEEEEEEKPQPKPKGKKSARERIDELTREKYELRRRLEALEANSNKTRSTEEEQKPKEPELREQLSTAAPDPDAKDKEGNPLYQLGEFDPKFIRDLTRFTIEQEFKTAEAERQKEAAANAERQRQTELASSWNEKLSKAEENIPDIREGIRDLVEVFQDVEPQYGDYLAAAIMGLDRGPEIMHYLSQNIGEAQKIVASGPVAATIAIGRIEAKLPSAGEEKSNTTKKVSKASEPPKQMNRGQGGKFATNGDTDDLDAFEREFFKKSAHPFRGR